jgi:hypothetical protein
MNLILTEEKILMKWIIPDQRPNTNNKWIIEYQRKIRKEKLKRLENVKDIYNQ